MFVFLNGFYFFTAVSSSRLFPGMRRLPGRVRRQPPQRPRGAGRRLRWAVRPRAPLPAARGVAGRGVAGARGRGRSLRARDAGGGARVPAPAPGLPSRAALPDGPGDGGSEAPRCFCRAPAGPPPPPARVARSGRGTVLSPRRPPLPDVATASGSSCPSPGRPASPGAGGPAPAVPACGRLRARPGARSPAPGGRLLVRGGGERPGPRPAEAGGPGTPGRGRRVDHVLLPWLLGCAVPCPPSRVPPCASRPQVRSTPRPRCDSLPSAYGSRPAVLMN